MYFPVVFYGYKYPEVIWMKKPLIRMIIVTMMIFASCTGNDKTSLQEAQKQIAQLNEKITELNQKISDLEKPAFQMETDLLPFALDTLKAISEKDFVMLGEFSSNEIRFSPYENVDMNSDVVIKVSEMNDKFESSEDFVWGVYDGSGEDIILTFKQYYEKFIYNNDFLNADIIGVNELIGKGNLINNISFV